MRGKEGGERMRKNETGITPAYAGKSPAASPAAAGYQDHPRVCGEKAPRHLALCCILGSPPRMRGKVIVPPSRLWCKGITPAYAGKSYIPNTRVTTTWDHPRVCGEKSQSTSASPRALGSPPRMRGKEEEGELSARKDRITPAYAGKSQTESCGNTGKKDHPRVCGEKPLNAL